MVCDSNHLVDGMCIGFVENAEDCKIESDDSENLAQLEVLDVNIEIRTAL